MRYAKEPSLLIGNKYRACLTQPLADINWFRLQMSETFSRGMKTTNNYLKTQRNQLPHVTEDKHSSTQRLGNRTKIICGQ